MQRVITISLDKKALTPGGNANETEGNVVYEYPELDEYFVEGFEVNTVSTSFGPDGSMYVTFVLDDFADEDDDDDFEFDFDGDDVVDPSASPLRIR